jgi:DNA-binding FadR family transcriptional regulator
MKAPTAPVTPGLGGIIRAVNPTIGPKEKRAELIARQIEADVFALGWPVGQVFGAEADLLERYGVSRSVLREAVRLLEHNRVARMRRGPGGGLVVETPAASVAAEAIATYFTFADLTIDEIVEARQSIEQMTAELAAGRITETGIKRLRALIDDEQVSENAKDHPLHIAVAELTGNAALVIFVAALSRASGRWLGDDRVRRGLDPAASEQLRRAHRAIADAIIAGDGARAQQRMAVHLEAAGAYLQSKRRRGGRKGTARANGSDAVSPTLAVQVADAIKRDVRATGSRPGEVIASEAQLIETHGVSRAVFREAIRILEHNGVAAMRRGPGGGLVVGNSDPSRVLEVVCTYLLYAGLDRNVIYDARSAVELTAVELAARRIDSAGAQHLEAALEHERRLEEDVIDSIGDVHVVLAGLSGNRALSFFARVLTDLTARLVPTVAAYPASTRPAVERAHRRIVDAVIAQDASMARHRMLRHLEALAPWINAPSDG